MVIAPVVAIFPTSGTPEEALYSPNQRFPSGPAVMGPGSEPSRL